MMLTKDNLIVLGALFILLFSMSFFNLKTITGKQTLSNNNITKVCEIADGALAKRCEYDLSSNLVAGGNYEFTTSTNSNDWKIKIISLDYKEGSNPRNYSIKDCFAQQCKLIINNLANSVNNYYFLKSLVLQKDVFINTINVKIKDQNNLQIFEANCNNDLEVVQPQIGEVYGPIKYCLFSNLPIIIGKVYTVTATASNPIWGIYNVELKEKYQSGNPQTNLNKICSNAQECSLLLNPLQQRFSGAIGYDLSVTTQWDRSLPL